MRESPCQRACYVSHVLLDVQIFDGLSTGFTPTITTPSIIEDSNTENPDNNVPPAPHLFSLLPPHAFAHIRPNRRLTVLGALTGPRRD